MFFLTISSTKKRHLLVCLSRERMTRQTILEIWIRETAASDTKIWVEYWVPRLRVISRSIFYQVEVATSCRVQSSSLVLRQKLQVNSLVVFDQIVDGELPLELNNISSLLRRHLSDPFARALSECPESSHPVAARVLLKVQKWRQVEQTHVCVRISPTELEEKTASSQLDDLFEQRLSNWVDATDPEIQRWSYMNWQVLQRVSNQVSVCPPPACHYVSNSLLYWGALFGMLEKVIHLIPLSLPLRRDWRDLLLLLLVVDWPLHSHFSSFVNPVDQISRLEQAQRLLCHPLWSSHSSAARAVTRLFRHLARTTLWQYHANSPTPSQSKNEKVIPACPVILQSLNHALLAMWRHPWYRQFALTNLQHQGRHTIRTKWLFWWLVIHDPHLPHEVLSHQYSMGSKILVDLYTFLPFLDGQVTNAILSASTFDALQSKIEWLQKKRGVCRLRNLFFSKSTSSILEHSLKLLCTGQQSDDLDAILALRVIWLSFASDMPIYRNFGNLGWIPVSQRKILRHNYHSWLRRGLLDLVIHPPFSPSSFAFADVVVRYFPITLLHMIETTILKLTSVTPPPLLK